MNGNNIEYFDSFGVIQHIPKEIEMFMRNKNITTDIYRIQAHDSICVNNFKLNLLILY